MADSQQNGRKVLQCDLHDYIEIACLFKYQVEVELENGELVTGVAEDTQRNSKKQECLLVSEVKGHEGALRLVLTDINSLRVLSKNARFEYVSFV